MVWEDFEDDETELLESCDGEARQQYFSSISRGLMIYLIALCIVLLLFFLAAAYAFWLGGS